MHLRPSTVGLLPQIHPSIAMASSPHLLLPLLFLAAAASFASAGADDLVAELQSLCSRSPSGVIHLIDTSVTRFLSALAPRPYSIVVFFDAASLHSKTDVHLPQLRREFALLSASFLAHNPASAALFFADIEFAELQHSFGQFGVNSLPHVRLIRPEHSRLADSEQMDQSHFARLADSMAEFVESRTGLDVGPMVRPPLVFRNQIILLVILFLISVLFRAGGDEAAAKEDDGAEERPREERPTRRGGGQSGGRRGGGGDAGGEEEQLGEAGGDGGGRVRRGGGPERREGYGTGTGRRRSRPLGSLVEGKSS